MDGSKFQCKTWVQDVPKVATAQQSFLMSVRHGLSSNVVSSAMPSQPRFCCAGDLEHLWTECLDQGPAKRPRQDGKMRDTPAAAFTPTGKQGAAQVNAWGAAAPAGNILQMELGLSFLGSQFHQAVPDSPLENASSMGG